MSQTLLRRKEYEEAMSDEHPPYDIALGFFLRNVVWSLLGNIAQIFYQCCAKSITTTLNRFFILCYVAWSLKNNIT